MKNTKPSFPSIKDIRNLLIALKPDIADEYRCSDDSDDNTPGIVVTIGANGIGKDWSYQTGDNSYTGGAYGFPYWAVVYLNRRSDCNQLAKEAIDELHEISWHDFSKP